MDRSNRDNPDSMPAAEPSPAIQSDLLCPLCDYNLRGLTGRRCPECGHEFEPDRLKSAGHSLRWLFEDQRGLALGALARTLARSCRPLGFWRSVAADHPVNVRRLVAYAVILAVLSWTAGWMLLFAGGIARDLVRIPAQRAQLEATLLDEAGNPHEWTANKFNRFGGVKAYIDYQTPSPFSPRGMLGPAWFAASHVRPIRPCLLAVACWPVLTVLVLVAFRKSLGRRHVTMGHLWRTTIYSGDIAIAGIFLIPLLDTWLQPAMRALADRIEPLGHIAGVWRGTGSGAVLVLYALLLAAAVRFGIACRKYLRWPDALPAALLIQMFVVLLITRGLLLANSGF